MTFLIGSALTSGFGAIAGAASAYCFGGAINSASTGATIGALGAWTTTLIPIPECGVTVETRIAIIFSTILASAVFITEAPISAVALFAVSTTVILLAEITACISCFSNAQNTH